MTRLRIVVGLVFGLVVGLVVWWTGAPDPCPLCDGEGWARGCLRCGQFEEGFGVTP